MNCNRFRLTADGKLRNCLFSLEETDIRAILRGGGTDVEIAQAVPRIDRGEKEGHEINTARFIQPRAPCIRSVATAFTGHLSRESAMTKEARSIRQWLFGQVIWSFIRHSDFVLHCSEPPSPHLSR